MAWCPKHKCEMTGFITAFCPKCEAEGEQSEEFYFWIKPLYSSVESTKNGKLYVRRLSAECMVPVSGKQTGYRSVGRLNVNNWRITEEAAQLLQGSRQLTLKVSKTKKELNIFCFAAWITEDNGMRVTPCDDPTKV